MAPSSIVGTEINRRTRTKNDKKDAIAIGKALMYRDYKSVHVPDEEDEAVRDFIRMREDQRKALKVTKQQIGAFCHRHGYHFTEGKNYWTKKHITWLKALPVSDVLKETLDEYLLAYEQQVERIARLDKRIEEIAAQDKYREAVHNLTCFKGIKTVTALALVTEIGDFSRFAKAKSFSAFLGLVAGQLDSSDSKSHLGITKQGNSLLRRLLVEAAQSFSRATPGKSAALKKRQEGCSGTVITYADKANERLRKRYHTLVLYNKKSHNEAATAVARELACFVWGMMTDHMHTALA
ncbi:IS110 family transposase [Anaerolactibacter massiliensis]|uniref:IS110 family transposase n=1 Tax=Anaerolactibacter massiliensis TaxID=2044573 RepID=UPI001EFC9369|nr:IS110 family transposase [Anaerolactibacter massiliensis]